MKAESILTKSLKGNNQLTRKELVPIIERSGISCEGQRAAFKLHRASLDRVICFGVKRDKQETHVLFEEWVAPAKPVRREDALAELARRYFMSHGPATIQDYIWWSGLSAADAKAGLETAKSDLVHDSIDGKVYWMPSKSLTPRPSTPSIYLLPPFDSYLLGYRGRSESIEAAVAKQLRTGGMPDATIMIDGKIAGKRSRSLNKDSVTVQTKPFRKFNRQEARALHDAVERYSGFIGTK
jgi:hypothetical protein